MAWQDYDPAMYEDDFSDLLEACKSLDVTREEQMDMFRIAAGVAHLGNLVFEGSEDAARVAGSCSRSVAVASRMLGIPQEKLTTEVCSKVRLVACDVARAGWAYPWLARCLTSTPPSPRSADAVLRAR